VKPGIEYRPLPPMIPILGFNCVDLSHDEVDKPSE
jgi:hypothetical protein